MTNDCREAIAEALQPLIKGIGYEIAIGAVVDAVRPYLRQARAKVMHPLRFTQPHVQTFKEQTETNYCGTCSWPLPHHSPRCEYYLPMGDASTRKDEGASAERFSSPATMKRKPIAGYIDSNGKCFITHYEDVPTPTEPLSTQDVNQSMHMTKDFCVDRYDVTLTPVSETKPVAAHEKVDKEALEKAIQTAFYGLNITRDSVVKIIETYESAKRHVGGEVDEGMGSPVRYTDGTISREYEEQPNADYAIKEILHAELVIATGEPDYNAHGGAQDLLEAIRPYLREAKE